MAAKVAITAAMMRGVNCAPMNITPITTVHTGMVKPKMEARPEGRDITPKIDKACHKNILGIPNNTMSRHSRRVCGHRRKP